MENRDFKQENLQAETCFGSDYRDASADDEFEAEDDYKYPQASLPFLVPKAPRLGPQRDVSIPGLPPLHPDHASAVAAKIAAAAGLLATQQSKAGTPNDGASSPESLPTKVNTTSYMPNRDLRRQTHHPGQSGSSTKPSLEMVSPRTTSAPLAANQGSSSPALKTENIAKLNVDSRREYRDHFPPVHIHHSDGDDEAADDDINTESDLETHVEDEDIDYVANPEDEEYESLRSRFDNVGIKRTHDTLEDTEDDLEVGKGKIAATANHDINLRGRHGAISLERQPTEEEKEEVRQGKKARVEGPVDPAEELGEGEILEETLNDREVEVDSGKKIWK